MAQKIAIPAQALAAYERLVAAVEGAERKANFGTPYTAINGNMYTMISKHGLVGIRLPAADRQEFMQKYGAELFRGDPAWPPAKEFVAVPADLLERTDELQPYLEVSLAYVLTLKPKPSKKAK